MNSPILIKEIKSILDNLPFADKFYQASVPNGFTHEFCQTFKREVILITHNLFPKIEAEKTLPNSFYDASTHHPNSGT